MKFTFCALLVTLAVFFNFLELNLSQRVEDPREQERGPRRDFRQPRVRTPLRLVVPNKPAGTEVQLPNGGVYISRGTGPIKITMGRLTRVCLIVQNSESGDETEIIYPPERSGPHHNQHVPPRM